jgi:hypothetical protein
VRIAPRTGALTWAKGVVPADSGDIRVEWRKDGRRFTVSVVLPADVTGEIALPMPKGSDCSAELDGQVLDVHALRIVATPTGDRALIPVGGGSHSAEITPP